MAYVKVPIRLGGKPQLNAAAMLTMLQIFFNDGFNKIQRLLLFFFLHKPVIVWLNRLQK
jgi:hypothetical protein